jgi:serine/threonine protein kinase
MSEMVQHLSSPPPLPPLRCTQAILHRQLVYPGHLSQDAVSFLAIALTRDPRARPTVRELLQHPFIHMHTTHQQQQQQTQ